MRRPLMLIALCAASCTSLAGIDDLVDVPCKEQVCPEELPDATADATADSPAEVSADVTTETAADAALEVGGDSAAADSAPTDTGGPDTTTPDTAVTDTGIDANPFDGGVCGGAPAPLVTITPGSGGYAIAATEVTRAQYAAFLASSPATTGQPTACAWNATYVPGAWAAPTSDTDCARPVVNVDWCDAVAYCKWAGRRLCGRIGGGILDPSGVDVKDPTKDEWHRVCTAAGTTDYAYGTSHLDGVCVDYHYDGTSNFNASTDVSRPVSAASNCRGPAAPYASVFDMTGNVREWEDACNDTGSPEANECRTRGGSFSETNLSCNTGALFRRDAKENNLGIRCCASL